MADPSINCRICDFGPLTFDRPIKDLCIFCTLFTDAGLVALAAQVKEAPDA